jgi:hypothetical protein
MSTEHKAEQQTAKELIEKMGAVKKYTVYLNDANNTVIQTNCVEIDEHGKKTARFNSTAKIVTNKKQGNGNN